MKKTSFKLAWQPLILLIGLITVSITNIRIYWMLIDDAYTILISEKISAALLKLDFQGLTQILFETQTGRFRPLYWILNWIVYLVGGTSPSIHRLFHVALYSIICFVIFKAASKLTRSLNWALFCSSLFALSSLNLENWLRLGPVEPWLGLLLLLSIYFLVFTKYLKWSLFFMLLSFLTKETAVALIPPIFILFIGEKLILKQKSQIKRILISLIASITLSIFSVVIVSQIHGGYSGNYSIEITDVIQRFTEYLSLSVRGFSPFFELSIFIFLMSLIKQMFHRFKSKFSRSEFYGTVFIIAYISLVGIQAPWIYVLERYMLPANIFLCLFMVVYLHKLWVYILNHTRGKVAFILKVCVALYFINFMGAGALKLLNATFVQVSSTRNIQNVTKYVAKNTPLKGNVYMNMQKGDHTIEALYEMDWHLQLFNEREDIHLTYLDDLSRVANEDIVLSGSTTARLYTEENLAEEFGKPMILSSTASKLILTTPNQLLKQSIKKTFRLIIFGEKFSSDGLFTFYKEYDYWNIYKLGKK